MHRKLHRNISRLCDYTGLTYCPGCHWNARSATPARILRNWQFEEFEVSQASCQYLMLMLRRPVINVQTVNPKLFAVVQGPIQKYIFWFQFMA